MNVDIDSDEFFLNSGSEQLAKIHGWARARYAAPWAVFFGVLLRVAASVPPHVQLPPVIGDNASLNMLCAFVGKSSGGKGAAVKIARRAWPSDVVELPIGSGQGIAEVFTKRDPETDITAAIFDIPEIDTLAGNAAQQGSILLATIKSFAMGELLGQANATRDARRIVEAHSYRGCLSVGVQPGHATVIFNDASGGLPQRFLWAPVVDPDMPGGKFPTPDPLVMDMPAWGTKDDGVVEVVYRHPDIETTIVETNLAKMRGKGNPLDGHAVLTRCKVAAVLAIMHGSLEVTKREWDWSATVMEVSNATRAGLERDEAEIKRRRFEERGMDRAAERDGYDAGRLESVIRSILDQLGKGGRDGISGSELRKGVTSGNRKWFEEAIEKLAEDGRVIATKSGSGLRCRLADDRHGGNLRHGVLMQLSGGGDVRQGGGPVESTGLENPSSSEAEPKKLSCQKWLDGYLDEKRAKGELTVNAFAVREAGEAAGYKRGNIDVAISKRGYRGPVWSLVA